MPIAVCYREPGGLALTCEGAVTGSDLIALNDQIYAAMPDRQPIRFQLCDLSGANTILASADDLKHLALQDTAGAQDNPNMLIAIVGERDLVFGLSRVWKSLADGAPFESMVFRCVGDAEKWLAARLGVPALGAPDPL